MQLEKKALELTGMIYDAALTPEKWQPFMTRLTQVMGARSALLREVDYGRDKVGLYATVGMDPVYMQAYREHFVHVDIYAPALLSVPVGSFFAGEEVVPWERQRNTEFYNDYMKGYGVRHVLGGPLIRSGGQQVTFGVQREERAGSFDGDDKKLIALIFPHMARAIQIHNRIADVTTQKNWALSALNHLRVGVILLNDQGRPIFVNNAAEQLAAKTASFVIGNNGLILSSASDTARLRYLISDATKLATGRGSVGGGCLRVHATAKTKIVQVQVVPLLQNISELSMHGGCVAVFVSTEGGVRLSQRRIIEMHGLTSAEARLALMLAEGASLGEASEAMSVSILTVRSQLKSIFVKTGVKRQAELVALLLTDILALSIN